MKIVSLVLKYLPQHEQAIKDGVEKIQGASVAYLHGDGRMIVLLEDGEGYAVSDSIIQVHQVPNIMSVTLAYEYSDETLALEEVSA